jgi:hypothetical protein
MKRQPRVYVVQRPAYRDRATGAWVDKYDLSAAEAHGSLVYLLPPGNVSRDLTEVMARLRHRLVDYQAGDHLLAAGDPVAIAAAVLVVGHFSGGQLSLLKWDRLDHKYYPYEIQA